MPIKYLRNINKKADLINSVGIADKLKRFQKGDAEYADKGSPSRRRRQAQFGFLRFIANKKS